MNVGSFWQMIGWMSVWVTEKYLFFSSKNKNKYTDSSLCFIIFDYDIDKMNYMQVEHNVIYKLIGCDF